MSKKKSLGTPPVVKEPRPLLTMGDIWNAVFAGGAYFLYKASSVILKIAKIPYNFFVGCIKTVHKVPIAGKVLALPFVPFKFLFGAVAKVISTLTGFFKIACIVLVAILVIKLILKLVSRIVYMRNKRKYKEYHKNLEERLDSVENANSSEDSAEALAKPSILQALKGMSFY